MIHFKTQSHNESLSSRNQLGKHLASCIKNIFFPHKAYCRNSFDTSFLVSSFRGSLVKTLGMALFLGVFMIAPIASQQAPAQPAPRPDALQLWRQGRFQDAVNVTLQELGDNPRNMDSYTVLGWSLLDMGRWTEARDYAQQALQISRFDYRIIGIMAQALFNLNQNTQALQYLREYVQLQPTGARVDQMYFIMGEIYIRLGEFNRADIALTTAVHHNPRNAQWWARLGFAREQVQNFSAARTAYQQALNIQPGLAPAQQGLTRVQARL